MKINYIKVDANGCKIRDTLYPSIESLQINKDYIELHKNYNIINIIIEILDNIILEIDIFYCIRSIDSITINPIFSWIEIWPMKSKSEIGRNDNIIILSYSETEHKIELELHRTGFSSYDHFYLNDPDFVTKMREYFIKSKNEY